ncbi:MULTISPECIES: hypothetical protein [unclassified Pseudomonas]|uniref:hypothetical protein n=1 Tax=unclassified Pseudomonas TaxID=196821 RepID=UPI000C8896B3|nr:MULTISPECIES: hypothetical protein [unclassified Pseudomonas]PNA02762.1 hypothetical protein C1X28_23235 [Pseudomonas sp. FW305-BF15]PNB77916.1 hypothetical protein C1X30_26155 [Pseudomonas sp. FW305-BF6]
MTNVKGNADGKFTATTSDPELRNFNAEEKFYSLGIGRSLQGWASLVQWPNERRNIALNFINKGDMENQTFDFADPDRQASGSWWKSTSSSVEAPFLAQSGTVTVTVDAAKDEAMATFDFVAVSQNGKEKVTVKGKLHLVPNDQGSAKP